MKILHLISSSGLFGAEQVLLNLAADPAITAYVGALHNYHNPHLEVIREAEKNGLPTEIFSCLGRFDLRAIPHIKRFLLSNNIDVIHTHNYKADFFGFIISRILPVKWVATNHVWHGTDMKLKFYETIDSLVLRKAVAVCAVSKEIKCDLERRGIDGGKVYVIDNGVDLRRYMLSIKKEDARHSLGIPCNSLVISIVGRLSPEKGQEIFIRAAAQFMHRYNNLRFLIVGDGPLRSRLNDLVSSLGITAEVIFAGIRQDMPAIYAASDVLVSSSLVEGLPMTILEAMAAQVPVVATRVGGIPDLIEDNKTGLLVESGNADDLARKIEELLLDEQKRASLTQAAFAMVQARYSVERMREEYRKVYESIVG